MTTYRREDFSIGRGRWESEVVRYNVIKSHQLKKTEQCSCLKILR